MLLTATSTDVERAFSHGGLTVSKMRHSLSDESMQAASVLGAWCDLRVSTSALVGALDLYPQVYRLLKLKLRSVSNKLQVTRIHRSRYP